MGKLILRPSFQKDLAALKKNNRRNYEKTCAVLNDIETDAKVSISLRPESRIPDAVKYELSDGYRLVFQKLAGQSALLALCAGKHDHVESFLDGHKGWVFSDSGKVREIRVATVEETTVEIVPSSSVLKESQELASQHLTRIFGEFTDGMFQLLEVPKSFFGALRDIDDPNSFTFMQMLEDISLHSSSASDLILAFATGNSDTKESILSIARGESVFTNTIPATAINAIERQSDEFISFDDPSDLQDVLKRDNFEQWQLFLHPDQKNLVERRIHGPARIRGISGSGKTVVAMHRARYLAKKHASDGSKVLFTTFNKELAKSARRLINSLCGEEKSIIEVTEQYFVSESSIASATAFSDTLRPCTIW